MPSSTTEPCHSLNTRMTQNFYLVWLDENINETDDKWRNSIMSLREAVNTVFTFIDANQCLDFITDREDTAFMILSAKFTEILIPILHNIIQINRIYILRENKSPCEKWLKECSKVSGDATDIISICEALKSAAKDYDHNAISISYIKKGQMTANRNPDTLDCSFMYTQMLKNILLTLDFNDGHFKEFISYCREQYEGNPAELRKIDKIEREYDSQQAIRWYTYDCCLYSMVNRALRTMDVRLIVTMGFFIRDLHNHITTLHHQQFDRTNFREGLIVYRGQSLSKTDFNQLRTNEGGLLAFNNFLSTSMNREVSLLFAPYGICQSDFVGVLFVINTDSNISTTPFAYAKKISYYPEEEDILFSAHSVFRIANIAQVSYTDCLWQVTLTMTSDRDPQLAYLMKSMEDQTAGTDANSRLAILMIQLAQYDGALELYDTLLRHSRGLKDTACIYNNLGVIKSNTGQYPEALFYYEKALDILQKTISPNHLDLATAYSNIAGIHDTMGQFSKALSHYDEALEIQQKNLPGNHPDLATSYNNIGLVYRNMSEYSKAFSYYDKALEIRQKALPPNHPDMATSYHNIAGVYHNSGDYPQAFSYFDKALKIRQKALPPNHPDLATSYNNIGLVYDSMGEYSKALSYYDKALEIRQKLLAPNHPDLASSYNNIAGIYYSMSDCSKALFYYDKALEIRQKVLPPNHPDLASSYNNSAGTYYSMGDCSKALFYYDKALEIRQKVLPPNHPDLAISYNNIGLVYQNMGEYSKALSYYDKAVKRQQTALPPNHPDVGTSYNNIAGVYQNMGEYSKALSYYEKALEIRQKALPSNHPDVATSYNNIAVVYDNMGEYSKALSHYDKALEIEQKALPLNHPSLATSYNNIGVVYDNMGEYSKALSYYDKALKILQKALPPNHPSLATSYNNIAGVYQNMGEYSKALSYYYHALGIAESSWGRNHPLVQQIRRSIEYFSQKL